MSRALRITPIRLLLVLAGIVLVGLVWWAARRPSRPRYQAVEAVESVVPATPWPPWAGTSPMAELGKANNLLRTVLATVATAPSPAFDAKLVETQKIVHGVFDFEELLVRAFGRRWDSLSPEQRTEIVRVFGAVMERMASQELAGLRGYDLRFIKETVSNGEATVEAILDISGERRTTTLDLKLKLLYKADRWQIYDVIGDGQSMVENYRAELDKRLAKESVDALIERMKKRLAKLESSRR